MIKKVVRGEIGDCCGEVWREFTIGGSELGGFEGVVDKESVLGVD